MSLFAPLSTRSLPIALVSHPQSCCPTMDVAVLSNPTNATGNACIQLYRLSGGSNVPVTASITSESTHSSSKVWETSIDNKAVIVSTAPPASTKSRAKGATQDAGTGAAYIQPRLPETLQWQPDGTTLAFASSTSNFMLYSVHDGKALLHDSPIAADEEHPVYLLNWESLLPAGSVLKKEAITAERLINALPKLSEVKKVHEKQTTKAGTFVNPFAPGFSKPYVPETTFALGRFPSVPQVTLPDLNDDELDLIPDRETEEALGIIEHPSVLALGDDSGNLQFLYKGAIDLGSIKLGEGLDIIAAPVARTIITPKTPFKPVNYSVELLVLASVPHQAAATTHNSLAPHVMPLAASAPGASSVVQFSIRVPHLPSSELSMLERASTSVRALLSHAYEAFDEARKGWEEVRGLGKKWLDRLKEEPDPVLPELQLLTLLLTGRPFNNNMHEYFASKNTERNLETWETNHLKAAARIRDTAFQHLNPVYERLTLWLTQMRGWALWPARFGNFQLDLEEIEEAIILLRLLMVRTSTLEDMALEEEVGFREFCGWVKFDLERIAAIEATSETRPSPKHDVLGVMTYIRQKLPSNPLDDVLRVEQEKTTVHCGPILESWIKSQRMATSRIGLEDEKRHLPDIVQTIVKEYQELGLDCEGLHGLAQGTSQANGHGDLDDGFMPEEERLFLNPPPMAVKPQPIQQARRKSTIPADFKQSSPILPTDLPIAFLLAELSRRLCSLFDRSFATITSSAQIDHVQHIMTWQPPDIEEDDALAVLGLARDPTKITTRLVRGDTNDAEPVSYIACETPQGCLPGVVTEEPASDGLAARAYNLRNEAGDVAYEILDIDFFDDKEVALLLRHLPDRLTRSRYSLATVAYQGIDFIEVENGNIGICLRETLSPIPFNRLHQFESSFEPLQFSLNGRAGRRIAAVLGGGGRVLEVLDMEEPDEEEEEEGIMDTGDEHNVGE